MVDFVLITIADDFLPRCFLSLKIVRKWKASFKNTGKRLQRYGKTIIISSIADEVSNLDRIAKGGQEGSYALCCYWSEAIRGVEFCR
jgi:hypothetical protein